MITFYATVSYGQPRPYMPVNVHYLLPASSWSRSGIPMKKPKLPADVQRVAADSGGFVATKIWGDYRYTPDQYVNWLDTFRPQWAATMDFCCEDEITSGKPGVVRERQQRTTEMAYQMTRDYADASWAWVVTVQGWHVEDYVRHARELRPLIEQLRRDGNPHWRVGIGTLCARANANLVHRVVEVVAAELPDVPLHLWGVKLGVLQSHYHLRQVVSVDSAAWHPGGLHRAGIEARQERIELGMSQMQHALNVALPRYAAKVEKAVSSPKQTRLL